MWRRFVPYAFVLSACVTTPAFPDASFEVVCAEGVVRGEDVAEVRAVAALLEDVAAQVRERMASQVVMPVKVLVVDDLESGAQGDMSITMRGSKVVEQYIRLSSAAKVFYRGMVAHELVHWYAVGPWDCLPIVLEEGLADQIACELDPAFAVQKKRLVARQGNVLTNQNVRLALSLPFGAPAELPPGDLDIVYAIGFRLTERLSLQVLRQLATQACEAGMKTVPMDQVLALCGPLS